MRFVDMVDAKSLLPMLVEAIEQGREHEIVIARDGQPVARLVPLDSAPAGQRLGVAKGRFEVPDTIDGQCGDVALLFLGERQS